jgi:hypothetical protein
MLDRGISFVELPTPVRDLVVQGRIELYRVSNIGPYRKLVPTLRRFAGSEFLVATADDDVVYPPGWLAGLFEAYTASQCVAAYRCRLIKFGDTGPLSYNYWPLMEETSIQNSSLHVVPTGRGGVLYHSSFFPSLAFLDELRLLAPGQDDLAFRIATLIRQIPVVIASWRTAGSSESEFPGIHTPEYLFSNNQEPNQGLTVNDVIWNKLIKHCLAKKIGTDTLSGLVIS